jgi:molybdate transport system substrate-binding protein
LTLTRRTLLVALWPALTAPWASQAHAAAPTAADSKELVVFAAASLTDAFGDIGKLFETNHPGASVIFNFAGSQQLAQQINEGAPADVFASANNKQMDVVIGAGEIVTETLQTFVKNRLVAIFPQGNPANLKELKDLAKPGLKLVLAAKEVPVGQYALDFLDKAMADPAFGSAYKEGVLANVVSYEENVKSVLSKVALGEADAGIVYTSDISGKDAGKVGRIDIPDALNVIATYPIAPLKTSKNPEFAQDFINLILSQEGQKILAKYNFIPVK